MEKVTITRETKKGSDIIETNVPFEAIKQFLDDYIKEHNGEDSEEEPSIISYIRETYPEFYEVGMKIDVFDEPFLGSISVMAADMDITEEGVIDMIVKMISGDGICGAMGTEIAAMMMANARLRWEKENK